MQQRLKGMKKAAREWRVHLTVPAADMLQDTASYYPLVDYLFGPKSRFTAVATVHPRYAVQLYEAFTDKNIRVPEDVSVVSYDDFYYSSVLTPPLTNVRQPMQEMGRRLARVVADMLEGKPPRIRQKLLPELIDRDSVGILSPNPLPP
jgi:DNA-binding LacI/PurR family transcriptional regulator